ncbi:MAG: OmpH family outer membrane protein [Acidiferrobacterales bacterium]|nr:OmpH family outer membrane protein [Acidiferrobacterales bacterium]
MNPSRFHLHWLLPAGFAILMLAYVGSHAQDSTTSSDTDTGSVSSPDTQQPSSSGLKNSGFPKIGYVNANTLMNEAPQGIAAFEYLVESFADRKKELEDMEATLKQIADILDSEEDSNDRRRLEAEFRSLNREFERGRLDYEEDFNFLRNEELTDLQNFISSVILQVAEDEGFDLIVQEPIVWVSDEVDITDEILNKLHELHNTPASQ